MNKISDLYRAALDGAAALRAEADALRLSDYANPPWNDIDHLNEQADDAEIDADYLAHCIAAFGDQICAEVDFATLGKTYANRFLGGCNPWLRGLAIIENNATTSQTEKPT